MEEGEGAGKPDDGSELDVGNALGGAIGCVLFAILIVEGSAWFYGEGVVALAMTYYRGATGAPVVEFGGSLWMVFFALMGGATIELAMRLGLDKRPGATWLGMLAAIALGCAAILLDEATVAPATRAFLARHGYDHCPALDREVHMGRGAVNRIEVYTRLPGACPQAGPEGGPPG